MNGITFFLILSLFSFILADQFETPHSSTGKSDLTFEQTTKFGRISWFDHFVTFALGVLS